MGRIFFFLILMLILYLYLDNHIFIGKCEISHDMTGKLVIITGASSGLGKFTALELLNKGAKVIFACRNKQKTENIFNKEIPEDKRHLAIYENLELSSFKSVINFVKNIKQKYEKIDIIINNAGSAPYDFKVTEDGFESYLQSNVLSHILLTYLLLDHMNDNSRIINLSSVAHKYCVFNKDTIKKIFDNNYLKNNYFNNMIKKNILYDITKLLMIYFTYALTDYFSDNNLPIKAVCLHPGVVNTEFMNFYDTNFALKIMLKIFNPIFIFCTKNVEEGSQTQLYLSYLNYDKLASGKYYADCKLAKMSSTAQDKNLGKVFMYYALEKIIERVPEYENDFKKFIDHEQNNIIF